MAAWNRLSGNRVDNRCVGGNCDNRAYGFREHDLERLLKLTGHFKIPVVVCINKWDLNPEMTARIESKAIALGCGIAGRIPYDKIFTKAMINGQTVAEYKDTAALSK
jgi:MinD superfamily P-loop ATPase